MVSVTLIGKSNGVGLARDLSLLADALQRCGCEVRVHAAGRRDGRRRRSLLVRTLARTGAWIRRGRSTGPQPPGRSGQGTAASVLPSLQAQPVREGQPLRQAQPVRQVNLMLEHVWPQFLHTAELNIAVPNPEWFDHRDRALLATVDGVWAKTRHSEALFGALGCRTRFIGFDSEDRFEATVVRERSFFHLAGKSQMKGTAPLLALWRRHPEWPKLIVVQHAARRGVVRDDDAIEQAAGRAGNIVWHREYLPDTELQRLQNASHFHLCLSEAEGWGHYIVEAMSVGAVTVTLDAAPMNELVAPDRGLLVPCLPRGRQNLADTFGFEAAALEERIGQALALDASQLERLGEAARGWFLDNRRGFPARIGEAVAALDGLA